MLLQRTGLTTQNPQIPPSKSLVLCLGNEIVSDDGFGAVVAAQLGHDPALTFSADVIFAPVAGFALLDLLQGRKRVLIVDTIQSGMAFPGTLHRFTSDVFVPSHHLTSSHQISLPTAIELGRKLGLEMPASIEILAVEAADLETLSESLTPAVAAAVQPAVLAVKEWILRRLPLNDPFERLPSTAVSRIPTLVLEEV